MMPRPRASTCLPESVRNVLFIRPGGIGDAALLGHTLGLLRRARPEVAIDVLAERRNAGVFPMVPGIRRTYLYDRPGDWRKLLGSRYDVVVDSEQWYRLSAVAARLLRSPVKIGFASNERLRLFTHAVPYSLDADERTNFSRLLTPLGIPASGIDDSAWLTVPAGARGAISRERGNCSPLVVIFPGASIPEKRWGAERFHAVARGCLDLGCEVVLVGAQSEGEDAGLIASGLPVSNLVGTLSLADTAAVIEQAALLVSGDSGLLHIAVGLGRSTVSLFGPSSVAKWGPRGPRHAVLGGRANCAPCSRFGTTPPCRHDNRCMGDISPDDVIAAIIRLLNEPGNR